jgi:hypothetical protein
MMTMSVPAAPPVIDDAAAPELTTPSARRAPAALAGRIASLVGHLIKLPVADPQCGSDVPRLRAVQDQALHSMMERRPGNVGFVLVMDAGDTVDTKPPAVAFCFDTDCIPWDASPRRFSHPHG